MAAQVSKTPQHQLYSWPLNRIMTRWLTEQLKEEVGAKKMMKMDLPSRRTFMGVNKRPDLIEKRRRELEAWLWKLIGDPEVARSSMLNNFLELSDAARLVQRSAGYRLTSQPST